MFFNYFLRTAERIFHRVCVVQIRAKCLCFAITFSLFRCSMTSLLIFLFFLCLFFLRSRFQQISGRYLLLFVLMTIIFHCVFFVLCYPILRYQTCVTCFFSFFVCVFWLESFHLPFSLSESVLFFMRLCECEYLFLNLMHFALTCKNVCVRVQVSMKVTVNEYVYVWPNGSNFFCDFFFIYTLDVAEN